MLSSGTTNTSLRILHVDQDVDYSRLVGESLERSGAGLVSVAATDSIQSTLARVLAEDFDAIVFDPALPNGDGLKFCETFRELRCDMPLIALGSDESDAAAMAAIIEGAQDYLIKGRTEGASVLRAIRFAQERLRARQQDSVNSSAKQFSIPVSPRVLLVEDNLGDAVLLEDNLAESWIGNIEVETAGRLSVALDRLSQGGIDAAIIDLALPDSRGLDTCRALTRQSPGLVYLVHSGSNDEALAFKTIQLGANDYITKGLHSGQRVARGLRLAFARQAFDSIPRRQGARGANYIAEAVSQNQPLTVAETRSTLAAPRYANLEKTRDVSYPLIKSLLVIPLGPGGLPDWERHEVGFTCEMSRSGLTMELETSRLSGNAWIVGVERRDGRYCYAGIEVRESSPASAKTWRVYGTFGGPGQDILDAASSAPVFDAESRGLTRRYPSEVFHEWQKVHVLRPVLLDTVQVCPRCFSLPTFRAGCASCGSGRVAVERMAHHFKCAYVGLLEEFERDGIMICPKCRDRNIVVGADFEYQRGTTRCQDCHWRGAAPEPVGQCLRCAYRFPGKIAHHMDLVGYQVDRLDALAFIAAP